MPEYEATQWPPDETPDGEWIRPSRERWNHYKLDFETTHIFYDAESAAEAFAEQAHRESEPFESIEVWIRELPATGSEPSTAPIQKFEVQVEYKPTFHATKQTENAHA